MRARPATAALVLVVALGGSAAQAAGQAPDSIPHPGSPPKKSALSVELRTGGAFWANFLQAPTGAHEKNVQSVNGEIRISHPSVTSNLELLGSAGGTWYSEFDPGWSMSGSARWGNRLHRMDWTVSFRGRSPRVEVGDTLGFADVAATSASYAIRPVRSIQLRVLAELDRQSYHRWTERSNRGLQMGGSARYYGFGYKLSPEVGVTLGNRDVSLDEEDHDERVLWVTLRSVLKPELYLSLRYRNRFREYTGRDPASRNFGRRDGRQDLALTVDVTLSDRWSWTAYLSHQDAHSTNESRIFQTQHLLTSVAYRLR
jgi:hypothetical protein